MTNIKRVTFFETQCRMLLAKRHIGRTSVTLSSLEHCQWPTSFASRRHCNLLVVSATSTNVWTHLPTYSKV